VRHVDVTVSDTLAQSYVQETSQTPGAAVAAAAAERKTSKYSSLSQSYLFVPIAAETMGPSTRRDGLLCDLGRHIMQSTDDHCESAFLFQQISVFIQCYNVVTVLGMFTYTTPEDEM